MSFLKSVGHAARYTVWLSAQVLKESVIMAIDTLGTGKKIHPVVIYYPLRVTSEVDIAALIASITMTPGTLALGITGPKEVDYDAAAGNRSLSDAFAAAHTEFNMHGVPHVQRFLAVHAMYGDPPEALLASLASMEEHLRPSVKDHQLNIDVNLLVERGREGPRGYHGSRGGRASDGTVFDAARVDSTPHSEALVAQILASEDADGHGHDVNDVAELDRKQRYEIARRNAEQARKRGVAPGTARPIVSDAPSDRDGRTKPGETLYDPLYPKRNPRPGLSKRRLKKRPPTTGEN